MAAKRRSPKKSTKRIGTKPGKSGKPQGKGKATKGTKATKGQTRSSAVKGAAKATKKTVQKAAKKTAKKTVKKAAKKTTKAATKKRGKDRDRTARGGGEKVSAKPTAKKAPGKKSAAAPRTRPQSPPQARATGRTKTASARGHSATADQPSKADQGSTVEQYLASLPDWQGAAAEVLRNWILGAAPQADETIKWSQPVYEFNGPFAYIKAHGDSVNVGFWRGAELNGLASDLEGTGSQMRHLKISEETDLADAKLERRVRSLVRAAIALNQEKGDPTKRR